MGGIALMDLWPVLKASGHFVEAGLSHMMSAPVEIPQGMLEGMQKGGEVAGPLGAVGGVLPGAVKGTLMSQAKMSIGMLEGAMGLAFGYMGAFMIATYATIGGAIGLPATWLTLKVFRPPFARASRSIKPAVSQDFEYEEMLLRSSADRFISDLEFALSDIPLEID